MVGGREIVSLHVGQAGNQIAEPFWEQILQEHGIQSNGQASPNAKDEQLAGAGVFFTEANGRYVPRSVQVDLERATLDHMRGSSIGSLFKPDSFFHGESGAGNNFAKGFYTEGAEHVEGIIDRIRKDAEQCDMLQGFQLIHSVGGGTGSGLGTLLLSKLREEFPDRILSTYSVMPSPHVSDTVTEPYNTVLTMHQLIELSDTTYCIDNEALYDISMKTLGNPTPQFKDLNRLVASAISGATTSLRFPGALNADLRKLATNMVPFPRLHFFSVAMAPLMSQQGAAYRSLKVPDLVTQMFSPGNAMVACDPRLGVYLTTACMFRGASVPAYDVEAAISATRERNANFFAPWIPNNIMSSLCDVPPPGLKSSATLVGNNTAIGEVFKRSQAQFSAMVRRRAFVHWYSAEGMDEQEMTEAESNVLDLIAEYQQYASADAEEEMEEELYEEDEEPQE